MLTVLCLHFFSLFLSYFKDLSSADELTSNECYYAELDGPTNVNWLGPVNMQLPRNAACSVAVNDKEIFYQNSTLTCFLQKFKESNFRVYYPIIVFLNSLAIHGL